MLAKMWLSRGLWQRCAGKEKLGAVWGYLSPVPVCTAHLPGMCTGGLSEGDASEQRNLSSWGFQLSAHPCECFLASSRQASVPLSFLPFSLGTRWVNVARVDAEQRWGLP